MSAVEIALLALGVFLACKSVYVLLVVHRRRRARRDDEYLAVASGFALALAGGGVVLVGPGGRFVLVVSEPSSKSLGGRARTRASIASPRHTASAFSISRPSSDAAICSGA